MLYAMSGLWCGVLLYVAGLTLLLSDLCLCCIDMITYDACVNSNDFIFCLGIYYYEGDQLIVWFGS